MGSLDGGSPLEQMQVTGLSKHKAVPGGSFSPAAGDLPGGREEWGLVAAHPTEPYVSISLSCNQV